MTARKCPECGKEFEPTHGLQMFCTPKHRDDFHNLQGKRGRVAMPLMAVWRMGKHGGGESTAYALKELCALQDQWNADDRKAGRNPLLVVAQKQASGWKAVDL